MSSLKDLLNVSKKTVDIMERGEGLVSDAFLQDFKGKYQNMQNHIEDIMNPNRDIHIGIVGQVKAGKSSFLNALLFDGMDELPKAATPMTAGLTRIVYADIPYAKVFYYSANDWNGIRVGSKHYDTEYELKCNEEKHNKEERQKTYNGQTALYDPSMGSTELTEWEKQKIKDKIPKMLQACKELTDMVEKNHIDCLSEKLGTEEDIPFKQLAEYIGAQGIYSPIVKSIEVGVNNPGVKGIEIIDTPGLGDPIVSRSERTREFLMHCDLVVFLSLASQFMSQSDMQLIIDTLPENGIQRISFIASKFDSAMLDDSSRHIVDLDDVFGRTQAKLEDSLHKNIRNYLRGTNSTRGQQILKYINEKGNLNCISSILFSAARKKEQGMDISAEEANIIQQMKKRFSGMDDDAESLKDLAGIEYFRDREFIPIKKEKDVIIAERQKDFLNQERLSFMEQIETIHNEAVNALHHLKEDDMALTEKRIEQTEYIVQKMKRSLESEFSHCYMDIKVRLGDLSDDVRSLAARYKDVSIEQKENKQEHVESHWFKKDTHWTEITRYHQASVKDVIQNIDNYIDAADKMLRQNLGKAIDMETMKDNLRRIISEGFMNSDIQFDREDIAGPIEVLLKKLLLPKIESFDKELYHNIIINEFADAVVKDEEIHSLMTRQEQVLEEIKKEYEVSLAVLDRNVEIFMKEQSLTFADDVQKQILDKLTLLKNNLQNKEENVKKYERFIHELDDCKDEYRKLTM